MTKEIYAVIDGKEYTREKYQNLVGKMSKGYALLENVRLMHDLGYTNVEIMERLNIPETTVRAYLKK